MVFSKIRFTRLPWWCISHYHRHLGVIRRISCKPDYVIGIDLGFTNSRVSAMIGQVPTLLQSMPSSVAVISKKSVLVGSMAKEWPISDPERTLLNWKLLVGRKTCDNDTQKLMEVAPFRVLEKPEGVMLEAASDCFSPAEANEFIIRELKEYAELYFDSRILRAVITVPYFFSTEQRHETITAGYNAGLSEVSIVDECVAAAYSSSVSLKDDLVAVLDFGGGTFNVSILRISDGSTKVVFHSKCLGGRYSDGMLAKFFVEEIKHSHGVDVSTSDSTMRMLLEMAEDCKMKLSSAAFVDLFLPNITGTAFSLVHLKFRLTRKKYESVVKDLIDETKTMLKECQKFSSEVKKAILVGGMSHAPWVQSLAKTYFEDIICLDMEPEESTVIGAAICGGIAMIKEESRKAEHKILKLSVGVETFGGVFTRILNRNCELPAKVTRTFSTECENQEKLCLRILEGERELSMFNKPLADVVICDVASAPQGAARIEVTFLIDETGRLSLWAKDRETGIEKHLEDVSLVELAGGDESDEAVIDAMRHGYGDTKQIAVNRIKMIAELTITKLQMIIDLHKKREGSFWFPRAQSALAGLRSGLYEAKNAFLLRSALYEAVKVVEGLSYETQEPNDEAF